MAYRRRHGTRRASTFEDFSSSFTASGDCDSPASTPSSPASQAIRAPAAHQDSSRLSANGDSLRQSSAFSNQDPVHHEYSFRRTTDERSESKYGFWGVLARKARSILEDDSVSQQFNDHSKNEFQMLHTSTDSQFNQPNLAKGSIRKSENLSSSLNQIGGTIKSALEEGLMIVESRAADIIQETEKIQIRRKSASSRDQIDFAATENFSENLSDQENSLKASRNLANAMAAKAKLLLRELKTVKAELAFAKERCDQLVEENKHLRESREKGDHTQDDDLIRLQLETLLAEKARLAQENSIYTRENRFLREIVEYHNLTMQDVVHLDDRIEDNADDGAIHISLPYSSHSASEVISPAISCPHAPPDSPSSVVQPDSSSPAAAPAPREDANEIRSSSSPKSELPLLQLKLERAD
ncbi:uncharacterized protein LOC110102178 isoform X1 [Dendrobium catenatum]|uniref:Uncharacterized protein n=1 Tax=Dendrobium catenatum TaxID=906689 RepID=A0A2I0XBW9_9ASPA|nr:uncharacterized protein LOC110102178 isoform X1 [Dendrobium catenatum]PKU85427.1 hypothetical protein MA16_Dca003166 [Dendrobium catenatum]